MYNMYACMHVCMYVCMHVFSKSNVMFACMYACIRMYCIDSYTHTNTHTHRTQLLGQDVSMPAALAPCGFGGMMHPNGEMYAARAAEKFGVPFSRVYT
jgi:hypothetical protein